MVLFLPIRFTGKMWELGKAFMHNFEELQSASRWRCFSYENQHHLLAKCYTSILCLKAFANSHTKISILAFPRLKVLLTYNFWLEIKNSCTILALFHKIQLWSSKRTLRYIGEIKSTITRLPYLHPFASIYIGNFSKNFAQNAHFSVKILLAKNFFLFAQRFFHFVSK